MTNDRSAGKARVRRTRRGRRPWWRVMGHAEGGFTLIELMVSLSILAVGLLGAAAIQLQAMRGSTSANLINIASTILYDQVDRIRMERWDLIENDTSWTPSNITVGDNTDPMTLGRTFTVERSLTPTGGRSGHSTMFVRVFWFDGDATNTRQVSTTMTLGAKAY